MYEQRLLHIAVGMSVGFALIGVGCGRDEADVGLTTDSRASTISPEVVIDPPVQRAAPGRWPNAAFDSSHSQYLVVWEDHRARRPILYAARLDLDGAALDGDGFPLLDAVPGSINLSEYQSAVAFDGANFLVVTTAAGKIRGIRVSPSGELLDPGGFVIATLPSKGSAPSLLFDGEQYFVAWTRGGYDVGADRGVYFAQVQPDGTVLDPDGVQISALGVSATPVGLSFDGNHALLSWGDYDAIEQRLVLNASRIAQDGTLIDQSPLRLNPEHVGIDTSLGPVAGFDGSNHVIAWMAFGEDPDYGYEIYQILANRVSPDGAILDPEPIVVHSENVEAQDLHRLAMAAAAGHSTVLWSMDSTGEGSLGALRMRAARIATDGTASVYPENTYNRGLEATMVENSGGGLMLWRDGVELWDDHPRIVGTRLDTLAKPLVNGGVVPASPASRQEVRAVASDGQNFFVLWRDTRDDPSGQGRALYGGRLAADGTPLDDTPIQITTERADLADVVFDGANYVVTWVRDTGGEGDGNPFKTVRVSPTGQRIDVIPLKPPLSSPYFTLDAASDGTHTLLVGADSNSGDSVLATVLIDQNGAAVSEVAHVLDEGQGIGIEPAVSFAGSGYLLIWHDNRKIYGQRISNTGALTGQRFILAEASFIHGIASSSSQGKHFVVWEDRQGIWARRVAANGQMFAATFLVDPPEPVFGVGGSGSTPAVASDGENFIVVWRAPTIPGDAYSLNLHAVEVRPNGEVSAPFAVSTQPEREGFPFLAGGDGRVLAAYDRHVPGEPYDSVRALARLIVRE